MRTSYDEQFDILRFRFNEKPYNYSLEIGNIVVDFSTDDEICGVEYFDFKNTKKLFQSLKLSDIKWMFEK